MMNIDELKQILEIVREHGITEFELEREDVKLRVKKNGFEVTPELLSLRAPAAVAAPPLAESRPAAPAPSAPPLEDAQLSVV